MKNKDFVGKKVVWERGWKITQRYTNYLGNENELIRKAVVLDFSYLRWYLWEFLESRESVEFEK